MRYLVDKETSIRIHEPVRSPRPTFDDGEVLSSPPVRSVWRDALVLAWIVVFAFLGFLGIVLAISR